MDKVAQRLADKAHDLCGTLTDIPYATWEEATETGREFWREIARASQDHGERHRWTSDGGGHVLTAGGKEIKRQRAKK